MPVSRSWLVVPVLGIVCAVIALASRQPASDAIALGACGAAIAATVRAFTGASAAASAAAAIAALIGVLGMLALGHVELARAGVACAAAGFAIAEIVRPTPPTASPWPAIGAAVVAGVFDPSFITLVAIAGVRLIRGPWPRPRWAIAVPLVGGVAILLAIACASASDGALTRLWTAWAGGAPHAIHVVRVASAIGDALGPLTAIAAIAGLAIVAIRGRYGATAVFAVVACGVAVDVRTGSIGAATLMVAAVAAGVAIGRLAAMIRIPAGQLVVGVTAGFLMLVVPALALL